MLRRLLVPLAAVVVSCGPATARVEPLDVRLAAPEPDAQFIDFLGTEFEVPAGKELMMCVHFRYDGEDTAFAYAETQQGKFGHHAVLLTALEPQEPGTVEDCTQAANMTRYAAFTLGDLRLPSGYGSMLTKGKALVMQSHYVNTGKQPILVRDTLRIKKMPAAEVNNWAAAMATSLMQFNLPPNSANVTHTFDCNLPKDVELLALGGHMHEYGTAMSIEVGPDAAHLTKEYSVPEWKADYRDNPPINLYTTAPKRLAAGTLVRVSCTWANTTDQMMGFPTEMCASFGFVGGTKEGFDCRRDSL